MKVLGITATQKTCTRSPEEWKLRQLNHCGYIVVTDRKIDIYTQKTEMKEKNKDKTN